MFTRNADAAHIWTLPYHLHSTNGYDPILELVSLMAHIHRIQKMCLALEPRMPASPTPLDFFQLNTVLDRALRFRFA